MIASGQDAQATTGKGFSRESAAKLVPKTNPFLRNLFQHIGNVDLDERVVWIADNMAQLLAQSPIGEILADFGKRAGKEASVVHFYEMFLAAYDAQLREVRGVYYTPKPVVSYIVRSLDCLLKTRFHKPLGLADKKTLILDPATGTGSFLFAVVNLIREAVSHTIGAGAWSGYVEKALLPRLFGFELLVASYAVAHLKLGLLLLETGYSLTDVRGSDVRGSEGALNQCPVAGRNEVEKARYEPLTPTLSRQGEREDRGGRVYVNATQYFDNVPPEVWECHVGGYQVCDKWLKDRKGRRLTFDDIQRYQRLIVALKETIRLMGEIDERIPGFPMSCCKHGMR